MASMEKFSIASFRPCSPCLTMISGPVIYSIILSAIRAGGWKYVEANEGNRRGLPSVDVFDLAVDPQEKRNLTGIDAERQGQLSRMLMAEIEAAASVRVKGSGNVIDDTTRSRLEALGYMDGEPEPESDKK